MRRFEELIDIEPVLDDRPGTLQALLAQLEQPQLEIRYARPPNAR
jgi:hypothetical protein